MTSASGAAIGDGPRMVRVVAQAVKRWQGAARVGATVASVATAEDACRP
jgi:hypothetical protein